MNILAFDTAFSTCSVGLSHDNQINTVDRFAPMQQSKLLLPIIADLLQQYALTPELLDTIVYGCGPGSFTGMRIAQSVAQGIGFAIQKPIIPISSMAILAQSAWLEHAQTKIVVCLDARMGKVHWSSYVLGKNNTMELHEAEQICAITEMPQMDKSGWFGIGDGWKTYNAELMATTKITAEAVNAAQEPRAEAILALANEIIVTFPHDVR